MRDRRPSIAADGDDLSPGGRIRHDAHDLPAPLDERAPRGHEREQA